MQARNAQMHEAKRKKQNGRPKGKIECTAGTTIIHVTAEGSSLTKFTFFFLVKVS